MSNRPNLWGFLDNNMEGVILIVLIIVFGGCCEKCEGQQVYKPKGIIDTTKWVDPYKLWDSSSVYKSYDSTGGNSIVTGTTGQLSIHSITQPMEMSFMLLNVNMSKGTIFKIDGKGNMYYKPSEFCKCDTATTMRFLYNIITNSYEKEEK